MVWADMWAKITLIASGLSRGNRGDLGRANKVTRLDGVYGIQPRLGLVFRVKLRGRVECLLQAAI